MSFGLSHQVWFEIGVDPRELVEVWFQKLTPPKFWFWKHQKVTILAVTLLVSLSDRSQSEFNGSEPIVVCYTRFKYMIEDCTQLTTPHILKTKVVKKLSIWSATANHSKRAIFSHFPKIVDFVPELAARSFGSSFANLCNSRLLSTSYRMTRLSD